MEFSLEFSSIKKSSKFLVIALTNKKNLFIYIYIYHNFQFMSGTLNDTLDNDILKESTNLRVRYL